MAFERKEMNQEEPKTFFWTALKWYWFIIPTIYYILVLPNLLLNEGGLEVRPEDLFTMVIQFSTYVMSGLMFATNPIEQSKNGVADKFLKVAVVQQFITRNIFGVILAFLAWYQLPSKVNLEKVDSKETDKRYFKPKTILVLSGISLSLAILLMIGQLN